MDRNFWLEKWQKNEIGFHEREANPALVNHFNELALAKESRIFLPLCGKTLDIAWLLENGCRVAGAELSEMAIEQLFTELRIEPKISDVGELRRYSAENIDIFCGDIFNLTAAMLGPVDAVYDRAALVALPEQMRSRYTAHLQEITRHAPQLLISFVYDQTLMAGPPFSVTDEEVERHYDDRFAIKLIENTSIPGGLRGKCPAEQHVWLLENR